MADDRPTRADVLAGVESAFRQFADAHPDLFRQRKHNQTKKFKRPTRKGKR